MKEFLRKNRGITLVALVVTLVVLLILAGISLSLILGQNGIIKKSTEAKENYSVAAEQEQQQIYGAEDWMNKNFGGREEIPATPGDFKVNEKYDVKTSATDEYGNKIVVPEGFKIVNNDDITAKHVNEGIVISDDAGNEFVWIPVGDVYTNATKTEKKTITLGRYEFDTTTGAAIQYHSGSAKEEDSTDSLNLRNYGNSIASDIKTFIKSANDNHGYYFGRYEARTTVERSHSVDLSITPVSEKANEYVYTNISQNNAVDACRNMYVQKSFRSELINSYSWDTAVLFQITFGTDPKYSVLSSLNTTFATKGTNNETQKDMQLNIYDMRSNCAEWSTETAGDPSNPCVDRGGNSVYPEEYTGYRNNGPKTPFSDLSARVILIM